MQAIYLSLIVLFIHATTWEGMIFEKIKDYIKPKGILYKPIYGCPICMTPWWGTLLYLIFFYNCLSITAWLWMVGAAAGFAVIWVCLLSLRDWAVEEKKRIERNSQYF